MTRRGMLCGLTAAVYAGFVEPRWFDVTRRRVALSRVRTERTVRVLHSDLHASHVVPLAMIADAIAMGLAERPDIVCLTGDFTSHRVDTPVAREYVRALRKLAATTPAFAVLGNHDGGRWAALGRGWANHHWVDRLLKDAGIELLHNRARVVQVQGQRLVFAGTGDYWAEEVEPEAAFRGVDSRLPIVLLAHNPDSKDICGPYCWDLMLSGHTHGGQVVVPLYGPPFVTVQGTRYLSGL